MSEHKLIVGSDIDGVLACQYPLVEDTIIQVSGKNLFGERRWPNHIPQTWEWAVHDIGYPKSVVEAAWNALDRNISIWGSMPVFQGAGDLLRLLSQLRSPVYFITSRKGLNAQAQSAWWLKRSGYVGLPAVVANAKPKSAVINALGVTLFIEDKPENVIDIATNCPNTEVWMRRWPFNESCITEALSLGVKVTSTLEPFTERVRELMRDAQGGM